MANTKEFNITGNSVEVLNANAKAADSAGKSYTSAKQELRALQNQMLEMDQSSEEFKKASARAAELKDNISDLSAEISANAGNAFEGLSNNVSLFGSRLMDLDLKGAGQALSGMGSAVSRIDFKTIKTEVGGLAKGLKDLGAAVLTNPFFLTVAVLGAIAYNYKDIAAWATQVSKEQQNLAKVTDELNQATQQELTKSGEQIAQIEILTSRVKDHNLTEKERRKALKDLETMYPAYFSNINGDINDTEALNAAKEKLINNIKIEARANASKALLEAEYAKKIALEQELNAKKGKVSQEEFDKAVAAAKFNQQTLFKETNQNISDWWNGTEGIGAAAVALEESIQRIAYLEQEASSAVLAQVDNEVKAIHKKTEAAITAAENEAEKKKRLQEQADAEELERRKKLDAEMMAEDDHMRRIELSDLIEAEKIKGDKRLLTEMQIHANLTALRAEQSAAELEELKKAEDAKAQLRIDAVKTSLSIISDLAGAFAGKTERQQKKAFQIQKGVSVATATIDTYLAAQGAYASQMSIKTPDAPIRAAVAAGIAIAQGLARVAVISKQQFNGSGGAAGSQGGGSVPSANLSAPTQIISGILPNQPMNQPPIQAYVIGGQVATSIEAQQLIQNQSRLGG